MKKSGTSKKAVQERNTLFVQAYIANGENATEAYLAVKPKVSRTTAGTEGYRLLKLPQIHQAIEVARAKLRARFAITTDRVVQELGRIAYFNPRRLLDAKGKAQELHKLDDDTAAGLTLELDGKGNVLKMRTVNAAQKKSAVETAVKILRLYDKPPPPPPPEPGATAALSADPKDTARRMAFLLARGDAAAKQAQPVAKAVKKKAPLAA